jgi:Glycosyltransferase Family 4
MRIAQIAPLAESVPPKLYGGTERVVSWLTDDLVELGHEVTLFASGDSVTRATLIAVWSAALRLGKRRVDPIIAQTVSLKHVAEQASEFDVIHFHTDWTHLPLTPEKGGEAAIRLARQANMPLRIAAKVPPSWCGGERAHEANARTKPPPPHRSEDATRKAAMGPGGGGAGERRSALAHGRPAPAGISVAAIKPLAAPQENQGSPSRRIPGAPVRAQTPLAG